MVSYSDEPRVEDSKFAHHQINDVEERGSSSDPSDDSAPDADTQVGIQNIQATTLAWTTRSLVFAFVMIWLTYFVEGMLSASLVALTPYVTSNFALHSLTPTVSILSSVIGGVTNLTLAKILDVFGRPQGYLFCVVLATVGLIMMAACNNVESYAAAQVFQTVGNNGIQYSLTVLIADTSTLRNRGLVQSIASSPNLITGWLAGPIASGFLALGPEGWRWAFGMFTIMVPAITLPLSGLFLKNYFKAKKLGLVQSQENHGNALQSFVYYCRQFDAVGLVLISAGVALFLLPFNLYTLQARGWNSPLVISMLVVGIVLIIAFVIWEKFFAPVTFIPYSLLLDRTVFGACILSAILFLSYMLWNSYFTSYLQVVKNLSVEDTGYVVQVYTVVSVLCAIGTGALIHHSGRFKPICLYVAIPLSVFGLGLMIHFRNRGDVGYIIMCQIFISIAAGIVIITDEIAVLAAASHQHVAVCLAVVGMFGNVGGAIGLTVASAIWQHVMPEKLMSYLPVEDLENLPMIYADLTTQLSYPVGSPTRIAIQNAYADTQTVLLSTGTGIWVIGLIGVLMWRDINVKSVKQQAKGHVW
uniref:Major facilitator superfamily (MFS) profile domain-containing protein n=1 Tax=Bionectria ochroleuca TaxID=29856 RepID=A0A8H7TVI3_BIOOC